MIVDIAPIARLIKLERRFILASKSPRRKKLLEQLGFDLEIMPAELDEDSHTADSPFNYAFSLSKMKAEAIASKIQESSIIIAADTIVVLDGEIMNKPQDSADAYRMLRTLSGRAHEVLTGVTLTNVPEGKIISDVKKTKVFFRELNDNEINAYIATGSPMDKAGAYGIQDDFGAVFVEKVEGCYYNIVGLPLEMTYSMLKKILDL